MSETVVDIGSKNVAQTVHEIMNRQWYESMLLALQEEAMRLGYSFVRKQSVDVLPLIVAEKLAYALVLQRSRFLYPMTESSQLDRETKRDFKSGYAQQFLSNVLQGLAENGIGLQAGKETPVLVCAEEARRDDLWALRSEDLLSAVRIHVGYEFRDLSNEGDKIAQMETLLSYSEFDDVTQMLWFLKHYMHDRDGQMKWVDSNGVRTATCPEITALITPMLNMSGSELSAITTFALAKLRQMMLGTPLVTDKMSNYTRGNATNRMVWGARKPSAQPRQRRSRGGRKASSTNNLLQQKNQEKLNNDQ